MAAPGSRRDHDKFCRTEGWTEVRSARGKAVRHHITYEYVLPDGRILRTRISRPANGTAYGADLWAHILRTQLAVTEQEFWACVKEGRLPDRGSPSPPAHVLPAGLVHQLINEVGLPQDQVAAMTLEDALAVMAEFWSRPR